jgi:hypothetical protein
LLVRPDVTREEHPLGRAARSVRQSGVVVGQQIVRTGSEPTAAIQGAKRMSALQVGSVDVRRIDPTGDLVQLLPHTVPVVVYGAVERDDLRTASLGIEPGVTRRDPDGLPLGRVASVREIDVVVEELPPLPQVIAGVVDVLDRVRLIADCVADGTGARSVEPRHGRGSVGIGRSHRACERRTGCVQIDLDRVVSAAVDAAKVGRVERPARAGAPARWRRSGMRFCSD